MEHPFFSLTKKKDTKTRYYMSADGKSQLTVTPTVLGLPTIWDKDLLIYTATLIREAMNRGEMGPENRLVRIETWNYLVATMKGDGMQQYKGIIDALDRLKGCMIKTSIETNGTSYTEAFSLIDTYKVVAKTKSGKIAALEIKVSDWLYGAIANASHEMLAINRNYFTLEGAIERRLYELAKKHCGRQPYWLVSIPVLWAKSGSLSPLKEFRRKVYARQVNLGTLPDYRVELRREKDQVIFHSKNHKKPVMAVLDTHWIEPYIRHRKSVDRTVNQTP